MNWYDQLFFAFCLVIFAARLLSAKYGLRNKFPILHWLLAVISRDLWWFCTIVLDIWAQQVFRAIWIRTARRFRRREI